MSEELERRAELEDAIAEWIEKNRPGYFLSDDPVARYAAHGARLRAEALRALAALSDTEGAIK